MHKVQKPSKTKTFGSARFALDDGDLQAASDAGLLRTHLLSEKANPTSTTFGIAYDRQENIGVDVFETQKAIQTRCKTFAVQCGFQLYVKHSSVKSSNSGNAKYGCKLLNGQQFFDATTVESSLECPFYFNVFGRDGQWKITEANFCHNHVKHVGFTRRPCIEGTITRPEKDKRNISQDMLTITALVVLEMLPAHGVSIVTLTGKAVSLFLQSKGIEISESAITRLLQTIDDKLHGDLLESYQKIEAYFTIMEDKNPGSVWRFEKEDDGFTFKRACFVPSEGIHIAHMTKRLFGFDGAHLKGEMNKRGVFLVATVKDFNNHIIPFGFALVPVENNNNWRWFLAVIKEALGDLDKFTAATDRQKGFISAVDHVFPKAGHRFCLRHIMDNINKAKVSLIKDEQRLICCMARSDCENDFKLYRAELQQTKVAAVKYLDIIERKHWVKYSFQEEFKLPAYGEITSNLSEQANNWMEYELCSAKPLDAFHVYFIKLSELLSEKRQMATTWLTTREESSLVLLLAVKRANLTGASKNCKSTPLTDGAYSVQHLGAATPEGYSHSWRVVDLPAQECTYGNWRDEEFPCVLLLLTDKPLSHCMMHTASRLRTSGTPTTSPSNHDPLTSP